MRSYAHDTRPGEQQRTELIAGALRRPPAGVGTFRYSNLGYTLAGAAIERLVGEPYEVALRTHLLAPLGITTSGFGPPPEICGHRGRLRLGPLIVGRGPAVDPTAPWSDNPAVLTPAGRLHLTIDDWSRFLRMFLTGSEHDVLIEASVDRLLTLRPGDRQAMGWAPAQRLGAVSLGQQGSNTYWVATALLDRERRRAAMVIVNDGRTAMLTHTATLAARLLDSPQ
jgi:CubicO group peptidase (beta-lactamase class C family)